MLDVIGYYLCFLFILQPIEEIYTCNNPNTIGDVPHFICNWEDSDFKSLPSGDRVLRRYRKKDNFIKRYYRNKYWKNVRYR